MIQSRRRSSIRSTRSSTARQMRAMDGNVLLTPPVLKLKQPGDERRLAEFAGLITHAEARVTAGLAGLSYVDPGTVESAAAAAGDRDRVGG